MTDTPSRPRARRRADGLVRADVVVTDGEPTGLCPPAHLASGRAHADDDVRSSRRRDLPLPPDDHSAKNA